MGWDGRVVVVTGGSSGVGRETAVQFARSGDFVVVAARRGPDLEETVRLCRDAGGGGLAVMVDVTQPEDVERLVERVLRDQGRIDVWVNNAGVTLFATLDRASLEEHRAVIETNLMGSIAAARAVLPVFERQGRGTMINVGSVLSWVAQPFVPTYVVSKFGLRGMTEALQAQYADHPHIHGCGIYPFSIDTPHFQTGGSDMPHRARAIPPVQSAERVAQAMVELARRPRRQVFVPEWITLGLVAHRLFPGVTQRALLHGLRRWHFDERRAPRSQGSLFAAKEVGSGQVHGRRRPRLRPIHFDAWVAQDFVKTELGNLRRRYRVWEKRVRS